MLNWASIWGSGGYTRGSLPHRYGLATDLNISRYWVQFNSNTLLRITDHSHDIYSNTQNTNQEVTRESTESTGSVNRVWNRNKDRKGHHSVL